MTRSVPARGTHRQPLNHPRICTIHETGESAGRPFLSLEFIEGHTLAAGAGQPLSIEVLTRLIAQAARALAAAHAAGVVHRDIKPANLMVRDDGIVKVLDVGLARRLFASAATGTDPGTRVGTLLYMSPEQAPAEPVGTATDVFSLGVVLYELATRRHPFMADTEVAILQGIASDAPLRPSRLNPEVSAPLEELILQMLAKDAVLRPTAVEVEAALTRLTRRPASPLPSPQRHSTLGREAELAAFRTAFVSAAGGSGLVLCVSGEPGIGKTTLVEDFLSGLAAGPTCRLTPALPRSNPRLPRIA